MIYSIVHLWEASQYKINEHLKTLGTKILVRDLQGCRINVTNYSGDFCYQNQPILKGEVIQNPKILDVKVTLVKPLAYIIFESQVNPHVILKVVFFGLPKLLLETSVNYHRWTWGQSSPNLILLPNLKNDPRWYLPLHFKAMIRVGTHNLRRLTSAMLVHQCFIHEQTQFRFYLETHYPISLYGSNHELLLGQDLVTGHYLEMTTDNIDITQTYYLSCNELISRKTHPIVRLLIGVYQGSQFLFSDHVILRIAPLILLPNSQPAEMTYLSQINGIQGNQQFIEDVTHILQKEKQSYTILKGTHPKSQISMYHRWMQDIMKFGSVFDQKDQLSLILKGPHFSKSSVKNGDVSYIYETFKDYPMYDFFIEQDHNLDSFGNVQVIPPILPDYPLGRILYGTSVDDSQSEISYNLIDLLESQQVQKPMRIDTGWLSVGHVDEIVSFVLDPSCSLGFRVLMVSTNLFFELLRQLDPETFIFDDPELFYLFQQPSSAITQRFQLKDQKQDPKQDQNQEQKQDQKQGHGQGKGSCIYQSRLKVKDLLSWTELIETNQTYQKRLDDNKRLMAQELCIKSSEIREIPICYWPKSLSERAKSIFPNMINYLYLGTSILVPKPFGPKVKNHDLFEKTFQDVIPKSIRIYFINNWTPYYLLEGDIHCGTLVKRTHPQQPWWLHMPYGAYDI